MKWSKDWAVYFGFVLGIVLSIGLLAGGAQAQAYRNRIIFVNGSGEDAVVKLVGPVRGEVAVPKGANRAISIPAGMYYIVTRYCDGFGGCTYTKGDPFTVSQTETQYSEITITLHKVPNGNYRTRPTSAADFDNN